MEQTKLELKRGRTKKYGIQFVDGNGIPISIVGWTIYFTVKEHLSDLDSAAKIKKIITDHVDAINGKSQISLSAVDTDLVGNYIFDITGKTNLAEVYPILEGFINFTEVVTQVTS